MPAIAPVMPHAPSHVLRHVMCATATASAKPPCTEELLALLSCLMYERRNDAACRTHYEALRRCLNARA